MQQSKTKAPPRPIATATLSATAIFFATLLLSFSPFIPAHSPAPNVTTEILFNEGTGTAAADGSGNAHNGTLTNGPTWIAGKYGQGISFDGVNDYVSIADHANFTLDPTQSYTWSSWVRSTTFNEWGTVWGQTIDQNNYFYYYVHTTADAEAGPVTNGITLYWVTNGSNRVVLHSNNNVLTSGQWANVAITYNGSVSQASRFTIYVNGVDVTNRTDVISTGTLGSINPTNTRMGANQPWGDYMNGAIDEVRFYRRLLSVSEIQSDMTIGATPDTQSPTASITAPTTGSSVSGTISVSANATDNVGVTGVQFLLDGVNLGSEDLSSPYSVSWNTTTATNGTHSLTAMARDAAGNTITSSAVSVTVNNFIDTEPPSVSISSPSAGATVSSTINVTANAADNVGVAGVQFLLDGTNLGSEDVAAPYSVSWTTTSATNGAHTLTARARDAAGNILISTSIPVTVFNSSLVAAFGFNENTGTAVGDNSGNNNNGTLSGGTAWSASGRFGAALSFDGTDDLVNVSDANSLDLTNGMTIEAWINPTNLTGYKTIICKENSTNNLAYALSPNNNTSGAANQRPNSRIRIGSTTSTVTGTTKLSLNTWTHIASTYDGTTLRFFVNGTQVATTSVTGNITATTEMLRIGGSPALGTQYFAGLIDEVRIYNRALSAAEIQTDMNTAVAPDVTNPTTSISSPANGATVSGTISVTANASDNIAVTGVQFLLDGNNLGTEDVTAPYSVSLNTLTVSNGSHTLTSRARDAAGNNGLSSTVNITVNNDIDAPTASITAPAANSTVAGTTTITADAADNVAVVGVQFLVDGNNFGSEDLVAPYSISWNTNAFADGAHTLALRARDAAGNILTTTAITVNILNTIPDTEAPGVNITSSGGTVSGTINITAGASDNIGVSGVQFLLDGNPFGSEDLVAPYSVSLNTLSIANGSHTVAARARDAAGNSTTSTAVTIIVDNDLTLPDVSISSPAAGSTVTGTVDITADASDNVGVVGVQFILDGSNFGSEDLTAPYSVSWNSALLTDGSHTLAVRARDAAGNVNTSQITVTTYNPDLVKPTVSITSPAAGNVSGTISVSANASDNIGVVGVQFLLDGVNLGSEDLTAPYSVSWNTTTATNGSHNLMAIVRDAAGNNAVSSTVAVSVNNDTQAPSVSITAPAAGTVSGTISVSANAGDNVGVVGVQFLLDGVGLGSEDLSSPYSVSWTTTTTPNGAHVLTARARDAAGNVTTSSPISVTVSNNTNLIVSMGYNEGTGTSAADISGNAHNGTLTNGPAWIAGKYGQGISFDGVNDYVSIADHANFTLDPTQSYTWSSWVRSTTFNEWGTVWGQTIDQNNYFYYYVHTTADAEAGPVTNGITLYWVTNGSNRVVLHSNNNVLTSGQWANVAITYNGSVSQASRFTIYVNGVDVTNRTDVISTGTLGSINPTNTRMGANQPWGDYMNGAIDEVRFYKRLLTATEIQADMNSGSAPDTEAPFVQVTSPANGSSLSGTVTVSANATDNVGVAGVQFLLDGVNLGTEDNTAPYSVSWNTQAATGGNHVLTAKARDAAGNIATSSAVNVSVVSDFTFTLVNSTRSILQTGSTDFKADIAFLNGFTSSQINLSVTGLPAGVTANFVTNPMTGQGQAQLLVSSSNATIGTYPLVFTAVAEGITHTQQATLAVTGPEDFALGSSPASQSVVAGSSVTYNINISEINDYVNPVTLSVAGLPAGVTASFNPSAPIPAATSVLTLTTSTGAPNGTYVLAVQGTSNGVTRSVNVMLTISSIPPSSLSLPTGFSVINIGGSAWDMPVGTAFTKDGQKMFVWEKGGKVYVCNRNSQQLYDKQSTPVVNIETEVGNWADHGLLGFALDPAFTNTGGYIYLLYVVDRRFLLNDNAIPPDFGFEATIGRVTRYKVITNGSGELVIDQSASERKILLGETKETGVPVLHDSHGMGSLVFASDGTLLVSTGDGASYNATDVGSDAGTYFQKALSDGIIRANENVGSLRSQQLNSLNGKILRIDPATGDGISSNPFYQPGAPRSAQSRVWALGLRNPFRFTVKPGTGSTNPAAGDIGEIYVGDVGYLTWEELNIIKEPGMNCGWPIYEGLTTEPNYSVQTTLNRDEPNPLAGGSCPAYFQFKQLLKQATADGITTLQNPCNTAVAIPNTTGNNRFFHRRPSLDWHHTQSTARVGIFSGNNAAVATIGTGASGVTSSPFPGNCSIGGCWYTGNLFPEQYKNTYFHGDYGGRWLKNFKVGFTDVVQEVNSFASGFGAIVSITENPADGTIYCVDLADNTIKRISYGGNQFPVLKMSSDKTYGSSALTVQFTGSNSFDPDGSNLTYQWSFGDNTTSTAANPSHTFTAPAGTPTRYAVKLTVKDDLNASVTDSIIISVNNTPPVVSITSPVKNSTYNIGPDSLYSCTAVVTDAEHANWQLKYQWQTTLRHNNHQHPGPIDTSRNTSTFISRVGCNGDDYYTFIQLTVTDAAGLTAVDSAKIFPNCSSGSSLLTLQEFSVMPDGGENQVKWVAGSGMNVDQFELEGSLDGYRFYPINRQRSATGTGAHTYHFADKASPNGVSYYRLKMIGKTNVKYSGIIKTFEANAEQGLGIYPNPVVSSFGLRYWGSEVGIAIIRISDINGKTVATFNEKVNAGPNIIYMQSKPEWKSGMYFVSVQQGKNIQRGKLIYQSSRP